MHSKLLCVSVLSVVAVICASALGADQGPNGATSVASTHHQVVTVEGESPANVEVGEIVRVTGSGPAGMVEITARTEGPVKLVGMNDVREVVNGRTVIGMMVREFEVKAQGKGPAKIIITIDNRIAKKIDTKEFKIEVR